MYRLPVLISGISILLCASCGTKDYTPPRIAKKQADSSACKDNKTGFGVIGGVGVTDSEFPFSQKVAINSSVQSGGFCSGTFVSPNVYISAAHCVYGSNGAPNATYFSINGVKATKVLFNPAFRYTNTLENVDVSVLIFPINTSKSYVPLADRPAQINDDLTLVGFGPENVNANNVGKRRGTSRVASILSDGMLRVSRFGGTGAISAPGDSGGTVLLGDKLVATMTGGDTRSSSDLSHLLSPENQAFLRSVRDQEGVEICGLDGHVCGQSKPSPEPDKPSTPIDTPSSPCS